MNKKSKKWIWICVSLLWCCVIFFLSAQTARKSSQESTELLLKLLRFFPWLTETILRKIAHFTEFCVLGLLLSHSSMSFSGQVFFGLCIAVTDETVQLFVPGRSGEVLDVWIDFAGCTLVCFVMLLLLSVIRKRKRHG